MSPNYLQFLLDHHADCKSHSDANLLSHLAGTWAILRDWGIDKATCDAGLFHSVYGTEKYEQACLEFSDRALVRSLIGEKAEQLTYDFSIVERSSFYLAEWLGAVNIELTDRRDGSRFQVNGTDFAALSHILLANWIEQRPNFSSEITASIDRKFLPILPVFNAAALKSYSALATA